MIILWLFLLLLCASGLSYSSCNDYEKYLSKDQTNSIKGIFILIVFLSHVNVYIRKSGYAYDAWGDGVFSSILSIIGQLMVVMFLFYSGYGVMESITRKGADYVKAMPRRRILNTLLNFDVAVCIFLIIDLLVGQDISIGQFLLSLIAWETIGNSNWYIFIILVCYTATWIIMTLHNTQRAIGRWIFLVLSIVALCLYFIKEPWWYNTLWAYPAGLFYSLNKPQIEKFVEGHYYLSLFVLIVLTLTLYRLPYSLAGFSMNALSVVFSLMMVVITMRVRIDNIVLRWCGSNLFPLYIYQRIPMIVLYTIGPSWLLFDHPVIYISICFLIALLLTYLYNYIKVSL